jgi:hypothetical protein
MSTRATDYPKNWEQIRAEILNRSTNASGQAQCEYRGECERHHGRCEEINHTWPKHRRRKRKVKIRFTIAHLCHTTRCDDKSHLRAMCEPCHLIYDLRCRQLRLRGDAVTWPCSKARKRLASPVSDEQRATIRRLSDEGSKAPKIADVLGRRTQVVAGIIARYKHSESWQR